MLGQSLPTIVVSFRLGWDRFAFSISFGCCDLPLLGLLFLTKMLDVNTSLAGKLGVYLCPFFVDGSVLVLGQIYLPSVNLAGVKVKVDVRVLSISVDSSESNGLRKGLFQELIC